MRTRRLYVASALAVAALAGTAFASVALAAPARPADAAASTPSTGSCVPDGDLVNPCRPWLGAAAHGNPGIPGQPAPGQDPVSQWNYLGQLVGHPLDIMRDYHSYPGSQSNGDQPLTSTEVSFLEQGGQYLDVNWNPSATWLESMPVADGGSAATNANIAAVAKSISKVAPHKVFLSLWHETNLAVSGGTTCPVGGVHATAGTPAQFIAAWRNVWNTFNADGATNVVWVMNYSSYEKRTCVVPQLWPGNKYVDWVIYDTYSHGNSWDQTAGTFYQVLQNDSTSTVDFDSKPWGIGEFGDLNAPTPQQAEDYFLSAKAALDANKYPKLKMYLVYADTGNDSGPGALTDFDPNGTYDHAKQVAFNKFFDDPLVTKP